MNALAPIPWQPTYVLTPDTLELLEEASEEAGHDIPVSDAWRSYAEQKGYHDAYLAYLNGGPYAPIASDPDKGQRNHMRGAAVDIQNYGDRAAMLKVGFTPDPDEWWHFNNPRWASMPIIKTNTVTASTEAHTIQEDDDMAAKYQLVKAAPPSQSQYFIHPAGISPIENTDPQRIVLEKFADAMNKGEAPILTDDQYKLVDEVIQKRL